MSAACLGRAERRAAIGQRPMAFGRHKQSAGTVCVRPRLAKPVRASRETRLAFVPSLPAQAGMEPRHSLPLGERRPRLQADLRRLGRPERLPRLAAGRPTYSSDEGST